MIYDEYFRHLTARIRSEIDQQATIDSLQSEVDRLAKENAELQKDLEAAQKYIDLVSRAGYV